MEWNTVSLYSYQGRLLGSPKWKGFSSEPLHPICISLCADTLVIRNQNNEKRKINNKTLKGFFTVISDINVYFQH